MRGVHQVHFPWGRHIDVCRPTFPLPLPQYINMKRVTETLRGKVFNLPARKHDNLQTVARPLPLWGDGCATSTQRKGSVFSYEESALCWQLPNRPIYEGCFFKVSTLHFLKNNKTLFSRYFIILTPLTLHLQTVTAVVLYIFSPICQSVAKNVQNNRTTVEVRSVIPSLECKEC